MSFVVYPLIFFHLIVLVAGENSTTTALGCDGHFYFNGTIAKCFWVSDSLTASDLSSASDQCANKGGTMATIDNVDEYVFVKHSVFSGDTSQKFWFKAACGVTSTILYYIGGAYQSFISCATGINQQCYKLWPSGMVILIQKSGFDCMQARALCEIRTETTGCLGIFYYNGTTAKCLWTIRSHIFSDAREYCKIHNGVLATVYDYDEIKFIASNFPRYSCATGHSYLWVGMRCNESDVWTSLTGELLEWNRPCPTTDPDRCFYIEICTQTIKSKACTDDLPALCERTVDVNMCSTQSASATENTTDPTVTSIVEQTANASSCETTREIIITTTTHMLIASSRTDGMDTIIQITPSAVADDSSVVGSPAVSSTPTCTGVTGNLTTKTTGTALTPDELRRNIEELKSNLILQKNNLSSRKRKLTSASDQRRSSVSIGISGLLVILAFVLLPAILELPTTYRDFRNGPQNTKAKESNGRKRQDCDP